MFLIQSFQAFSSVGLMENFDLKSYSPIKNGLKDLSCEIRVKDLTKEIKKDLVDLKVKGEIYFKLYWLYPGKFELNVEGLPDGFEILKSKLKGLVVNRLDYLIPSELSKKTRAYKFTSKKVKRGTILYGNDPTNTLAINKIELKFDNSEKLKTYKTYSPLGFQSSSFDYEKKSWSKNKWVLKEVKAKTVQGPLVTEIDTVINYENNVGFGFPSRIIINSNQYDSAPEENEVKNKRTGVTELAFSKFEVNKNIALKYFNRKK